MSSLHRIECITKDDQYNPFEQIRRVGGRGADGTPWTLTLAEAIEGIEAGRWRFYVQKGEHMVFVRIMISGAGHKYLKTDGDDDTPDNLLSLPEC